MSKLRKAAKGQECHLMIYPYCNDNPETVVLCHLPSSDKGMSIKSPDWWAVFGCSACHDVIDGRRQARDITKAEMQGIMMRGLFRTLKAQIEAGLISVR